MISLEERLWRRVDIKGENDCWEWQGWRHPKGHGQIGRGRRTEGLVYTHVAAWEIANNMAVPKGLIVRHKCDNPPCCNPSHLETGTPKQNTQDAIFRKRLSRGDRHASKLTWGDVCDIRRRLRDGQTQQHVAEIHRVSRSLVGLIGQGLRWSEPF